MGPSALQIIVVLLVIVLLFGAKKLPQIGKGMGEALRNFKKSVNEIDDATDITPIASKKQEDISKKETKEEDKKEV